MNFRSILMLGVLGGGLLLTGCEEGALEPEDAGVEPNGAATEPGDVAEGEVPAATTVTVTGEVEKRYDDRTVTISGEGEWFDPDLTVVSKNALPAEVTEDTKLTVTGTVRKVGVVEIERELGWDFDPEIEVELDEVKTFLVADSVEVVAVE